MQRSEEIGWPAALPYVETYLSTCRSIRDAPPIQQVLETVVARLNSKNTMQVVLEAEAGSSEATLDMILRCVIVYIVPPHTGHSSSLTAHVRTRRSCTGVGARKDPVIAFQYIDKLLHPRPPLQVAPSDRAHGLALLAHLFYEDSRSQGPNTLNTDALSRAAIPANQAASMGFVCPIILQIAQMIERTGFRNPANIPPDRTSNPFQELPDLWRVWDMRVAEIAGKDEERDEKVRQNPNLYFCARRGCGIEAIHKSALRSCGGKCPPHGKPAYCSRECQKEVRFRLQAFTYALLAYADLHRAQSPGLAPP